MGDGARMLDAYLSELRTLLRNLPEPEVSEIEAELRSHVRDSGTRGGLIESEVAATLARLGSPAALASLYDTDRLLVRAGRSRSPWLLLWSLFRWAAVSVAGICVLIPVIGGYLVAASFFIAALVKPFAPDRVGLWRLSNDEFSLRLGLTATVPPRGQELLGWAIVPLGLIVGSGTFLLAVWFGRWAIRSLPTDPAPPDPLREETRHGLDGRGGDPWRALAREPFAGSGRAHRRHCPDSRPPSGASQRDSLLRRARMDLAAAARPGLA